MSIRPSEAVEVFTSILSRHEVAPDAVVKVEAAWRAFSEFLHVRIDGLSSEPGSGADGFIVQWGRVIGNVDHHLYVSFTRQLAVVSDGNDDAIDGEPQYWMLELEMAFDDRPELLGMEHLPEQNTGFRFDATGSELDAVLTEIRSNVDRQPALRAAWNTRPVRSELTRAFVCG